MHYEGIVYRPPSEAASLIVQVTVGCSYNRCRFCTMYKDKTFKVRGMDDIKRDFHEARARYGDRVQKVFLADGDALVLSSDKLLELLSLIHDLFPKVKSITAYGSPGNILRKSPEELVALKSTGLSMLYMGAESGDDGVLRHIQKGVTRDDILAAGNRLTAAGLPASITLISGLGGKERLSEHAIGSADLISRIKPAYAAFLTLIVEPSAPIYEDIKSGRFTLLTPEETVTEMEMFLKHVRADGTVFRANHASNYLTLKGTLNGDIPAMLTQIDAVKKDKRFRQENWRIL